MEFCAFIERKVITFVKKVTFREKKSIIFSLFQE